MSIAGAIIDPLLGLHGTVAYSIVGVVAFAEAAAFVGFVLPGETAVVLGGVLAYRHAVSLPIMMAVVVIAAISGDSVGYEVGKRYGQRLLALPVFNRHRQAIDNGRARLQTNGGPAVLLSRFTAFLRAVMPGLAGASRMPYRKFLTWNAAGGIAWGVGFTLLGYLAGASYKTIESYAGDVSYVILGLVIAGAGAIIIRHQRRNDAPLLVELTPDRRRDAPSQSQDAVVHSGFLE
jgi:membrane protein DedA with SNARE-associated domain